MAIYPSAAGSTIGSLLRGIQEDQSKNPLAIPPSTATSSPIRGMIQQPLMQAESPESARVIAIRPEVAPLTGGEQNPNVIAPVAPAPVSTKPVTPVAPITPVAPAAPTPVSPSVNPGPSASSVGPSASSPARTAGPAPSAPAAMNLATRISAAPSLPRTGPGYPISTLNNPIPTPAPQRPNYTPNAGAPVPTPTIAYSNPHPYNAPRQMSIGDYISQLLNGLGIKINPSFSDFLAWNRGNNKNG